MTRILFPLLLLSLAVQAQKDPITWGKVPKADLSMTSYEAEPDAPAVILADYGKAGFSEDMELEFDRHVRIKILKPEGLRHRTITIPYRYYQDNKEKLTSIKGMTHRLVNGKTVKSKIKWDDLIHEEIDYEFMQARFDMPDVEVGSVIEYKFKITIPDPSWFPEWFFQNHLPTRHTEFRTHILETHHYAEIFQGEIEFDVHTKDETKIPISYKKKNEGDFGLYQTSRITNENRRGWYSRWVINDVPPLREEPHIAHVASYRPKLAHQLNEIRWEDRAPELVMGSWEDLRRKLWFEGRLGSQVRTDGYVKELARQWTAEKLDPMERLLAIYQGVQRTVKWNGLAGMRVEQNVDRILRSGEGSAPGINLCLVSLLRASGVQAYPVLISTRDHGQLQQVFPVKEQFNYVLAMAKIGEMGYLLDGTDPLRSLGMLPENTLNGKGWVIDKNFDTWVDLVTHREEKRISFNASMNESGELEGKLDISANGYEAIQVRRAMSDKTVADLGWLRDGLDAEITEFELVNQNDINENLLRKLKLKVKLDQNNGQVKLQPMITADFNEHLFPNEDRLWPVEFDTPRHWTYVANITVPEGYTLARPMKPQMINAPNRVLSYRKVGQLKGNRLTVSIMLKVNQFQFKKDDYQAVRKFYKAVVESLNQEIQLQKSGV